MRPTTPRPSSQKVAFVRSNLEEGQPISIPRCYFEAIPDDVVSVSLRGFCDASLKAYAGVVYLLVETAAGFSVRFVAAKTRVSPLKEQTIPRLELLSALLLTRLMASITKSLECDLQLSPPRCFSDSTVALCWIKAPTSLGSHSFRIVLTRSGSLSPLKPGITVRVETILQTFRPED